MKRIFTLFFLLGLVLTVSTFGQWKQVGDYRYGPTGNVTSLIETDNEVFVSSSAGVFLSTDSGINWISKRAGIPDTYVWCIIKMGANLLLGTNVSF